MLVLGDTQLINTRGIGNFLHGVHAIAHSLAQTKTFGMHRPIDILRLGYNFLCYRDRGQSARIFLLYMCVRCNMYIGKNKAMLGMKIIASALRC